MAVIRQGAHGAAGLVLGLGMLAPRYKPVGLVRAVGVVLGWGHGVDLTGATWTGIGVVISTRSIVGCDPPHRSIAYTLMIVSTTIAMVSTPTTLGLVLIVRLSAATLSVSC